MRKEAQIDKGDKKRVPQAVPEITGIPKAKSQQHPNALIALFSLQSSGGY